MVTRYEIKHLGRTKSFDNFEEAVKHGSSLEKLGYNVILNMVTHSLYSTITTKIYETSKNIKSSI